MIENKRKLIFCDGCQTVMKVTKFSNHEERIKLTEKVNQIIIDSPEIMEKQVENKEGNFKFYSGPSLEIWILKL
jgi:protein associated with RNAse G/E